MHNNVCVFASSSNNLDAIYYEDAKQLGEYLGQNHYNIVYGGSRLGLMFACANAVKSNGGKIIGIMPKKLCDFGVSNPDDCDEFFITEGMRERKDLMDKKSNSIIALAGGFGTLEEISEMIVQKQLGYNNKAIVFLNTNGFYNDLLKFFDTIIGQKFAKYETKKLYFVADSPKEAVEYLNNYDFVKKEIYSKF